MNGYASQILSGLALYPQTARPVANSVAFYGQVANSERVPVLYRKTIDEDGAIGPRGYRGSGQDVPLEDHRVSVRQGDADGPRLQRVPDCASKNDIADYAALYATVLWGSDVAEVDPHRVAYKQVVLDRAARAEFMNLVAPTLSVPRSSSSTSKPRGRSNGSRLIETAMWHRSGARILSFSMG